MTRLIIPTLVALMLSLQACQTTGSVYPSGPIHPITSPITIGNQSVVGAEVVMLTRTTLRRGGESGYIEIRLDYRLSVDASDEMTRLRMDFVDFDFNVNNLNLEKTAIAKLVGANLDGAKGPNVELRNFHKEKRIEIEVNGKAISVENEPSYMIVNIFKNTFVTGRSIGQGDLVFDFDMSDFMGSNPPQHVKNVSGRLKVIAIGHTLYEGRLAIVCKGGGPIKVGGKQFKAEGLYYLDVLTGLASLGETKITGINKNNVAFDVTQINKIKF